MCKKLIYLVCFVLVPGLGLGSAANAADVTPQLYVTFDGSLSGSNYVAGAGEIVNGTVSLKNGTEVLDGGILTTAGGQEGLHFMPTDSLATKNAGNEDIINTSFVIEGVARRNAASAGFQTFFCVHGSVGYRYISGNPTDTQYWTHGPTSTDWAVVSGDGQPVSDTDMVHYALVYEYISDTECKLSYYVDAVQFGDTLINTTVAGGTSTWGMMFAGEPHPSGAGRGMPLDMDTIAFSTFTGTFNPETDFILPGGPGSPNLASNPSPADRATDVSRDVVLSWKPGEFASPTNGHKVYLGESFDDVNDAVGGVAQTAAGYAPPQRFDFGTTYYWRVDEVNAPPTSHVEFKGEVWSFTTEPIGYAIEDVNATASSALSVDTGPENTVNGSGMDADDLHSVEQTDMWISGSEPEGAWIEFEFDRVYKLHQMLIWNSNQTIEYIVGFGCKGVTIEYSADGNDYTTLGTTGEFAQAPGAPGYAHNTTIDFGGVVAKNVRLTISSNWGFLPQYSLSEVRFTYIPVLPREPQPQSWTTDMDVDVTLSFRPGREAAEHNIYVGTDLRAVMDGTAPVTTVTEASHGPLLLDLGQTYYWKVNEVNDAETPTMWEGDVWSFRTQEYFVVENFEDYNDYPGNRIYETWADGWEIPTNGAMLGYPEPLNFAAGEHILETTDVHSGKQSLPFFYDNSTAASSEATVNIADLPIGSDWTGNGVKTLSLWFSGDVNNVPEQMYVKLNGVKVAYDSDADSLTQSMWQPWNIHLTDFAGVDLSNVIELSIGLERIGFSGGSGMVLFDDIRLYPFERQLITPVEPGTAGLVGHYELDGNANDSSGNNHRGTLVGDPQWVAGHIGSGSLDVDGRNDYVDLGDPTLLQIMGNITMAAWIKTDAPEDEYDIILAKGYTTSPDGGIFLRLFNSKYQTGSWDASGNHMVSAGGAGADIGQWVHLAGTYDGSNWNLYKNGHLVGSAADSVGAVSVNAGWVIGSRGGGTADRLFGGLIDDARIYDRALSWAEIAWLGGVAKPFDKPF